MDRQGRGCTGRRRFAVRRAGSSVAGDGSDAVPSEQNGYSIVEAADLDGAKALLDGHPFILAGDADYAVEIFELLPM